ncbi:hypothetical protein EAY24_22805, partial [Vibrio anguillarum]|uniref:protein phosphatase CheZ n=2 Tax=Vibrio anguillarum TaxID=55601 RepID=UPI001BE416D1
VFMSNGICLDDIEEGLNHVSDIASDLHDELVGLGLDDIAKRAERLAYVSWIITKLEHKQDWQESNVKSA